MFVCNHSGGCPAWGQSPRYTPQRKETTWGHKSHTYIKIFTQRGTVSKPDQTVNRHPLNAYNIFNDSSTWEKQKQVRKKWRNQLFGGIMPGQGAKIAASVLKKIFAL